MRLAPFNRRSALRRLHRNADGVAAVEFAIIAPVMFLFLVGSVEFSQAITVDRRVTQIASSTADLIAREKSTTRADIEGMMQIIDHLMRPYDPAGLKVTVLSVVAPPNAGATTVSWSFHHNGGVTSKAKDDSYPLPAGLVEPGNSVIVAEVSYHYEPPIFSSFIQSGFSLQEKFFLKPRLSSYVACPDC